MKRLIAAFAVTVLIWAQPAAAQSILRDAGNRIAVRGNVRADDSRPPGLSPRDVKIVLINDDSINAFVGAGRSSMSIRGCSRRRTM